MTTDAQQHQVNPGNEKKRLNNCCRNLESIRIKMGFLIFQKEIIVIQFDCGGFHIKKVLSIARLNNSDDNY